MNYDTFLHETMHRDCFKIINVEGDNKCFYRSVINNMLHFSDANKIKNPSDFIKRKRFHFQNNIEDFPFVSDPFFEKALHLLESKTISWLNTHRNDIYPDLGLKISELIEITHEIPLDQYVRRDFEECPIWGGLPEQIAISNIYNVPVYIYRSVKYNKKTNRICEGIIKGDMPNRDARFQQIQRILPYGGETPSIYSFCLLWKKGRDHNDHYMSLFTNKFQSEEKH